MLSKVSLLLLCGLLALCASVRATDGQLPTIEQVVAQQHLQQHKDQHQQMLGDAPAPEAAARSAADSLKDLRCYQCNSMDDAGCEANNTLKEKYLKACPTKNGQTAVGCWKLSQKVDYDQGVTLPAHSRVVRQCAYMFQEHPCANRAGYGGAVNQCFCNVTRCNSGTGLTASLVTLGAALLVAGKLFRGVGW